jgi:nucleoside-diphosphate-sugar epimerase
MRILLTGDLGRIGVAVRARLERDDHDVVGFDAARHQDVRDLHAVRSAMRDVDAVVHLAGLADDRAGAPEDIMAVNVLGTWHVLLAAQEEKISRIVYASSGKALGLLERDPVYLPIDDAHPGLPSRPYGLSKWLSEQLCESFTNETGIPTVCLRPVLVLDEEGWRALGGGDELPPGRGRRWHLGVFVDLDDVTEAVAAALVRPERGHVRALLCAEEIAARRPTVELVSENLPAAKWRDGQPYPAFSRRALVDCSVASQELGWRPARGWPVRALDPRRDDSIQSSHYDQLGSHSAQNRR